METPSTSNGNGFGGFRADDVSDAETRTAPSDTRHPANASCSFSSASSDAFVGIPFPVSPVSPVSPGRAIGPERGKPPSAVANPLPADPSSLESPSRSASASSSSPSSAPTGKWSTRTARRLNSPVSLSFSSHSSNTPVPVGSSSASSGFSKPGPRASAPSLSAFPDDDPIDPKRRRRRLRSCSAARSRALKLTPTYRPCSGVIRSITPYCPPGSSSVSPRPHHHPTKPAPRSRKSAAAA